MSEPNVFLEGKNVITLEVYDHHTGKWILQNTFIDHVEIMGNTLKVEVNSEIE